MVGLVGNEWWRGKLVWVDGRTCSRVGLVVGVAVRSGVVLVRVPDVGVLRLRPDGLRIVGLVLGGELLAGPAGRALLRG